MYMGLIQRLLGKSKENKAEFKAKLKQAQDEDKIDRLITERAKSANQREVERYVNENQEAEYKKTLDYIRKKQTKDSWKGKSILENGTSILHTDKNALSGGKSIMNDKNIFMGGSSDFKVKKKKGLFFKR